MRFLRVLIKGLGLLLVLLVLLLLFVRSPWGQDIIISQIVRYVESKTGTELRLDRFFVTFSGELQVEGLYLEDRQQDTLLHTRKLTAHLPLSPLLRGQGVHLRSLHWSGATVNIHRKGGAAQYNFQFLVDAFTTPDTAAQAPATDPMQIKVGSVDLEHLKLRFLDDSLGLSAQANVGNMLLEMDQVDLSQMVFKARTLQVAESRFQARQFAAPPPGTDTTATSLPTIAIKELHLEDVGLAYAADPDGLALDVNLDLCSAEALNVGLPENRYSAKQLVLEGSKVALKTALAQDTEPPGPAKTEGEFQWPEVIIDLESIRFKDNHFSYAPVNGKGDATGGFQEMDVSALDLMVNGLQYQPGEVALQLEELSFRESRGIRLNSLSFVGRLDRQRAALGQLRLSVNNSRLQGNAALNYPDLEAILAAPKTTAVGLALPVVELHSKDVALFSNALEELEMAQTLQRYPLSAQLFAQGTLDSLILRNTRLAWGPVTELSLGGLLRRVTDTTALSYEMDTISFITRREDVLAFVPKDSLGLALPQAISLRASAQGDLNALQTQMALRTSMGDVQGTADLNLGDAIQFQFRMVTDSLQLGTLLQTPTLGLAAADISGKGTYKGILESDLELEATFSQLMVAGYDYGGLALEGELMNGEGDLGASYRDDNLNMELATDLALDSLGNEAHLNLHLIGADLQALGFTRKDIRVGARLQMDYEGGENGVTAQGGLSDIVAVYENERFREKDIGFKARMARDTTLLDINSDLVQGTVHGNGPPTELLAAMRTHLEGYFDRDRPGGLPRDTTAARLDMQLHIRPTPMVSNVFFKGVEQLDSVVARLQFSAAERELNGSLRVPHASYKGSGVDSLVASLTGTGSELDLRVGFAALASDPINIKRTALKGSLEGDELLLELVSTDSLQTLAQVQAGMRIRNDSILFQLKPDKVVLNRQPWQVPPDNQILIAPKTAHFKNVRFRNGEQAFEVGNALPGREKEHLALVFKNFELQTFASWLNPDTELINGNVNGEVIIENPFGATGLVADVTIDALTVYERPLGLMRFNAASQGQGQYDFDMEVSRGFLDLEVTGNYRARESGALLDMDVTLDRMDLDILEGVFGQAIEEAKGSLSGFFRIAGTTQDPEMQGSLNFNETVVRTRFLGSDLKVDNETLRLSEETLFLDTFALTDASGQQLVLHGEVNLADLRNPGFDLALTADDFKVFDNEREDNDLFYGKALVEAQLALKGDLQLPQVRGRFRVLEGSEVTFLVPESQLDIEEREGVVLFVNRTDTEAILTRNEDLAPETLLTGYDIQLVLETDKAAVFRVVIDERTGDNLQVAGNADLNLNMAPNDNLSLTGRYVLASGHYEASLYNLVNRRFEVKPGGTLTWSGDPMNAALDVTAIYRVETAAAPLMTAVTSGQDASTAGRYRQQLPFLVYLNVDGELEEPELSFDLEMPEEEQGALGGTVYGRVRQLNQQESQLNKQVFSLLAFNRFYPSEGSDGSSGGTASLARDNVNKVLSGELNAFSDRVLGDSGFEVDFDLDSFTDYQGEAPQDRTQLNINAKKKLFNDRLIVTAGSAVDVEGSARPEAGETPIVGNLGLEYLITDNGRWRLRGYRKNEYQNIVDGQLIVTGLALIFNREFNHFSQLFRPKEAERQRLHPGGEREKSKTSTPKKTPSE
ncbi:translocation/assembly module TamB domain-containing protein [Maribacter sp. 2307ULW6-5]|uniref:translocation/assembly module TamB domain-containing protein n=1 Tax=Maribacter sp. 2307ULW6-5 TaxID=3386275 RepID=UPI0039BC2624